MVDKIDRPEAPPPYFITRAKDAKESQHQAPNQREEQERRRQKELTEKEWGKFDKRTMTIRPIRVTRSEVIRCLFRQVSLHSGVGTLQVDVFWKDGRTTRGALVLLSKLEDFVQLKKFSLGQEVPESFWAKGQEVEFGIIQMIGAQSPPLQSSNQSDVLPAIRAAKKSVIRFLGILNGENRINWGFIALYLFFMAIIAIVIIIEVRG